MKSGGLCFLLSSAKTEAWKIKDMASRICNDDTSHAVDKPASILYNLNPIFHDIS